MVPDLACPLIDVHTHLMPERLARAVREYLRAHLWPPRYGGATADLVNELLGAGVDRFVFMPYAHRAGMASSLNHWVANVQSTFAPHAIGFGTFHPDDGARLPALVDEAFGQLGLVGAKLHPPVGGFAVDDPRLDPLYERATRERRILLIHAGRQPQPGPLGPHRDPGIAMGSLVGAHAFARLMRRFPRLKVVVAHAGADEFEAFFDLCGFHDDLYLDTAMVFNGFLGGPPPVERVLEYQDRIVYGSDFPNIPYALESAIQAVRGLRLGRALEQKIFCTNAARLLGLDPEVLA
jgi:uncharacterized protein